MKLFRSFIQNYPDSPWLDEALLHIGCDARYRGRYNEANDMFGMIISRQKNSDHQGAHELLSKAKLRLAVLCFLQNDFAETKALFNLT